MSKPSKKWPGCWPCPVVKAVQSLPAPPGCVGTPDQVVLGPSAASRQRGPGCGPLADEDIQKVLAGCQAPCPLAYPAPQHTGCPLCAGGD